MCCWRRAHCYMWRDCVQFACIACPCAAPTLAFCPAAPPPTAAGNMLVRPVRSKADSSALLTAGQSHYELIPIDHGFALPEAFEPPYFEWQHWPQVRASAIVQLGWAAGAGVARCRVGAV